MDFLQLLMIQLQYQDPMSPMDSQEFAAQLAEFSQLEQITQMNQNLTASMQTNLVLAQSVNNTMAASMIGKDVVAYGNEVELADGQDTEIHYELDGSAQTVTIEIKNENGATVRTIEAGPQGSGEQQVTWDGTDDDGNDLPDGIYTYTVSAETASGTAVNSTTYTFGTVTGVSYTDGMAEFLVGSITVSLSDIYQILES
jgi:flagellar basal-body rod modification protein FlgD